MAINLGRPPKEQPSKIWIGINIEFIQPTKTLFQRIFKRTNYPIEIDFDISVLAIDQNRKIPDEKCFIFYNQPSSIGINLDTFNEAPVAPEFDEIISIDFNQLQKEISSLKFIISNHQGFLFEECEIYCFIYDTQIWTKPLNKALLEFSIKPVNRFNLIELFEIHIKKLINWELHLIQNPINSVKQNSLGEYIKFHEK